MLWYTSLHWEGPEFLVFFWVSFLLLTIHFLSFFVDKEGKFLHCPLSRLYFFLHLARGPKSLSLARALSLSHSLSLSLVLSEFHPHALSVTSAFSRSRSLSLSLSILFVSYFDSDWCVRVCICNMEHHCHSHGKIRKCETSNREFLVLRGSGSDEAQAQ